MLDHAYWIVLLPLISALTIFFFGRFLPMSGSILGILAMGYGLCHSVALFVTVLQNPGMVHEASMTWFRFGIYQTELGILIDGLSAVMLIVVCLVSLLVQIYSLGYMHGEPRFKRFYAYLSLFTFSMLLLVVSNNLLQFFVGWEVMGLASYLLIGFYFEKDSAANAGKKAFITTRVGDTGFFIGIMTIFSLLGTLNFGQLAGRINDGLISGAMCSFIALCLFAGAAGKSAQFPLFIWLPEAMEGPTPVSALIHAATMVAAGIYMIARTYFIFEHGHFAMEVIAAVGLLTAFMAASMALVTNDIKRVLAFSTVSQLGYMMLALGVGGRTAGIFHLTTHAFFKALLFLGAGSVIHAVHSNDIREMGGLSKKMLWTFWTFTFAWIAISGIWPFAGFFSKDMILEAVLESGHHFYFYAGVFVAFMTAFYMTRLYLLVFVTDPRDQEKFQHAHESPISMLGPLAVLAVLSLVSGLAFHYSIDLGALLGGAGHAAGVAAAETAHGGGHGTPHWFVPAVSSAAAVAGILLSFIFYASKNQIADNLAKTFQPVYKLLDRRYFLDEFFIYGFVKPGDALARALSKFDQEWFDRWIIDGTAVAVEALAQIKDWIDRYIVDGLVNLWGKLAQIAAFLLGKLQTGAVQNYILVIILGFAAIVWARFRMDLGRIFSLF